MYIVCCDLTGYAADPSVQQSDATAPDAVIGDVQKFKEMKGLYFLQPTYTACYTLH